MKRALLLALLLAGPARAFEASGELILVAGGAGSSAAFDADRLVGPAANLTRMEGGAWTGDILGHDVALEVTEGRLRAPNLELYLERDKGVTRLRGNFFGRHYNLAWGPKGVTGRAGACSVDLARRKDGLLAGQIGCLGRGPLPEVASATLKLIGQAGEEAPPLPQFALALIAVIP